MKRAILPLLLLFPSFVILLSRAACYLRSNHPGVISLVVARGGQSRSQEVAALPVRGASGTRLQRRFFGSPTSRLIDWGGVLALIMRGVSDLGRPISGASMIVLAATLLALRGRKAEALFALATASGPALSFVLKAVIRHNRPMPDFESGFLSNINRYSFPSGHVVFFEVFFGFLAYLAYQNLVGAIRWLAVGLSGLLIVLVGPSRVLLGAHWAGDVAGGYIIGSLWLSLVIALFRRAQQQQG